MTSRTAEIATVAFADPEAVATRLSLCCICPAAGLNGCYITLSCWECAGNQISEHKPFKYRRHVFRGGREKKKEEMFDVSIVQPMLPLMTRTMLPLMTRAHRCGFHSSQI